MAPLLKSRDSHLAGGEKWSFFSWGRWGRPASFNSLQTYVPHPPSLRDDHRGHDRRHRHPHRPCHCHFHSHLQKFFPNSVSLGSSAIVKVPEQVGAAKSAPRKVGNQVPRKGSPFPRESQARVPRFPGTGSQARSFPSKVPKRFPQARFPGKGSKARFASKVPRNRFPSKVPKRFPGKVPRNRFPSKVPKQGSQARFPSKVPKQGSQEDVPK